MKDIYVVTTCESFKLGRDLPVDDGPLVEDRTVTAISFNKDGQVKKVTEYTVEDGRFVNYVDRKTPTRGRELSAYVKHFKTNVKTLYVSQR